MSTVTLSKIKITGVALIMLFPIVYLLSSLYQFFVYFKISYLFTGLNSFSLPLTVILHYICILCLMKGRSAGIILFAVQYYLMQSIIASVFVSIFLIVDYEVTPYIFCIGKGLIDNLVAIYNAKKINYSIKKVFVISGFILFTMVGPKLILVVLNIILISLYGVIYKFNITYIARYKPQKILKDVAEYEIVDVLYLHSNILYMIHTLYAKIDLFINRTRLKNGNSTVRNLKLNVKVLPVK